jgi:hypothetical protein
VANAATMAIATGIASKARAVTDPERTGMATSATTNTNETLKSARIVFLDSTIAFSIPTSIATMVFAATAATRYELSFATVVPIIATAPTLPAVAAGWEHEMDRKYFRLILASISTILGVLAANWAGRVGVMESHKYPDHNCESPPLFESQHIVDLLRIFPLSYLGVVIFMLMCVFIWRIKHFVPTDAVAVEWAGEKVPQKLKNFFQRKTTRAIYTLVNLLYAWAGFAILILLRIGMWKMAGDDYEENKWGFGQIVAVGLWISVVAELLYGFTRKFRPRHRCL